MSRLFSRLLPFGWLFAMAVSLLSCGSSSHPGTGGGSGSGGSGSGGANSTGGFAAGIGGAGQNSSAHFLIATMVPGLTPFATTINSGGTLTQANVTVGHYSVFNPMAIDGAIDPTGTFFYEAVNPGLWAFTINRQNGSLSEMSSSPYDQTVDFEAVVVDQLGKFLYAFGGGQVYAYSIQAGTGQLTAIAGSPFPASASGEQFDQPFNRIAVSQDNKYLYVGTSTGVFAYSINSSSGVLTEIAGSPFGGNAGMAGAIIAPSTGFVYELAMGTGTSGAPIYGYSIDSNSGALSPLAGSPFSPNCSGTNMTSPASGKFLFAANCGIYQIDSNSGALTFLFPDPTAPYSSWAVFDPPGDLIWVVTSQEPCFDCNVGSMALQVDANTGKLTEVQNSFFQMTNTQVGDIQSLAITQ